MDTPTGSAKTISACFARCFSGLGDGADEGDAAPIIHNAAHGLAGLVQLPVATRILLRRVEDRVVEERMTHPVAAVLLTYMSASISGWILMWMRG